MPPCPDCHQPVSKRNGRDRRGGQKYACSSCRRTFTENTTSAFNGYRWPPDIILTAVRWYLSYPLSSRQVRELLAERGVDVSHRTILMWAQAFGPLLAAEVRNQSRYARIAAFYDVLDWPFEPLYRPGRALIGAASAGITLELGAGTGKNFPYYGQAAHVIASDLSLAMLVRTGRGLRTPIRGLLVADATCLPLRDASVDTVVATFVCCVLPDPRPALGEIARVLRPRRQALFLECVLPPTGWQRTLMRVLEPPMHAVYGVHWERDLPALIEAAGMKVTRKTYFSASVIRCLFAAKP